MKTRIAREMLISNKDRHKTTSASMVQGTSQKRGQKVYKNQSTSENAMRLYDREAILPMPNHVTAKQNITLTTANRNSHVKGGKFKETFT